MTSAERRQQILDAIAAAARLARREPEEVTLVAVSKTRCSEDIEALIAAGQRDFGESRVQEALAKWPGLRDRHPDVRLHCIGRLQSNKAAEAVRLFDVIHSLDRPSLLEALVKEADKAGRAPALYVQVNIGEEEQKGGCAIGEVGALVAAVRASPLPFAGLMAIPPLGVEPAPYFALLAELARRHYASGLSMGMSADFGTAVMLGATVVRVGTALFEDPMALPRGLILDFDGVLLESEFEGNRHLAELLTSLGHPTRVEDALTHFTGLSGQSFIDAIETRIGVALPAEFHARRSVEDERALREGVAAVAGAVEFVRSLPPELPKAVASSSTSHWVHTHLAHIGLDGVFGYHVYSGREHVERGKPAPDLYWHAAGRIGVPIGDCVVIEDSEVGAKGALASGARVIGLVAGAHCLVGHDARLEALGVREIAHDFGEVRRLIGLE